MSTRDEETWGRIEAAAAELRRRVATVHERVACPKCGAVVGERCARVRALGVNDGGQPLKHPHPERVRADGIPDR